MALFSIRKSRVVQMVQLLIRSAMKFFQRLYESVRGVIYDNASIIKTHLIWFDVAATLGGTASEVALGVATFSTQQRKLG